jgi:hypothetical protein
MLVRDEAGNNKGGSITVPLTSCLTGLESAVWQLTICFCKTDQSKPVKQEVTGTVILPPLLFPAFFTDARVNKQFINPDIIEEGKKSLMTFTPGANVIKIPR